MALAIFDLDNTLLAGDSDYEWGQFLVRKGLVDQHIYEKANRKFYQQYKEGVLDIFEFSRFAFKPLEQHPLEKLLQWRQEFLEEIITPLMLEKSRALIQKHKDKGDTLLVITATNSFITSPIVKAFGIPHLLATDPLQSESGFKAEIDGTPCFQEGKVIRLKEWMNQYNTNLQGSTFYSDSHNDLPLLEMVDTPVAVDPDDKLATVAHERGWDIISLR